MDNCIGNFSVNSVKGELLIEYYYEVERNILDYKIIPIYKIGEDVIDFKGQSNTFMKHKKAIDYILEGKNINELILDNSWNRGFKILGILGRGNKMNKSGVSEIDYFKAFFFYQVFKGSNKLKKYYVELPEKTKPKKVTEEDTIHERVKLAQLILDNNMNSEDVELIKDTVLSSSFFLPLPI